MNIDELVDQLVLSLQGQNKPDEESDDFLNALNSTDQDDVESDDSIKPPIKTQYNNIGDFGVVNPRHPSGHQGVDLQAPRGTAIYSIAKGNVTHCGTDPKGGNVVSITHANGIRSYYAHLDKISCKKGDVVDNDTIIGTVGNSGNASVTSPHLHFQIWDNGKIANPANYFNVPKYSLNKKASQIDIPEDIRSNLVNIAKEFISKVWIEEFGKLEINNLDPVFKTKLLKNNKDLLMNSGSKLFTYIKFDQSQSKYSKLITNLINKSLEKDKTLCKELGLKNEILITYLNDTIEQAYRNKYTNVNVYAEFKWEPGNEGEMGSTALYFSNRRTIECTLLIDPSLNAYNEAAYDQAVADVTNSLFHEFMHFMQYFVNGVKAASLYDFINTAPALKQLLISYYDKINNHEQIYKFVDDLFDTYWSKNNDHVDRFDFKYFVPKTKIDYKPEHRSKGYLDKLKEKANVMVDNIDPLNPKDGKKVKKQINKTLKEMPKNYEFLHELNENEFFPQHLFSDLADFIIILKKIPKVFRLDSVKLYIGMISLDQAISNIQEINKKYLSLDYNEYIPLFNTIHESYREVVDVKKNSAELWKEISSKIVGKLSNEGLI